MTIEGLRGLCEFAWDECGVSIDGLTLTRESMAELAHDCVDQSLPPGTGQLTPQCMAIQGCSWRAEIPYPSLRGRGMKQERIIQDIVITIEAVLNPVTGQQITLAVR